MGMSAGGARGGVKSEINVTPLVDVVLVLLIIFMVITPMMKQGRAVELPHTGEDRTQGPSPKDPLYVSVTADRKVFLEQDEVSAAELPARVEGATRSGRRVLLKGDRALTVGDVVAAMDGIRRGRVSTVHLAVEPRKGAR
jgi:biopolymer transport protein TolR